MGQMTNVHILSALLEGALSLAQIFSAIFKGFKV